MKIINVMLIKTTQRKVKQMQQKFQKFCFYINPQTKSKTCRFLEFVPPNIKWGKCKFFATETYISKYQGNFSCYWNNKLVF